MVNACVPYFSMYIYWDELIGIPYLKCNPGGDCCWVQEHPNVYTRQAQKHATIDTLNFTVGMMHVLHMISQTVEAVSFHSGDDIL